MDSDLRDLIDGMSDDEAMELAVAVKQHLDDPANEAVLETLSPASARSFVAGVAQVEACLQVASADGLGTCARSFLVCVAEIEALEPIVTARLVDSGVRLGLKDVAAWFTGTFNLASLLGISFVYEHEKKTVEKIEGDTVESKRTIRIAVGQ